MDVLARYADIVDDFEAFVTACDRPLPSVVRVNTIKTSVDRAKVGLREAGIDFEVSDWHPRLLRLPDAQPGTNWPYVHGWLHGQEEVSAAPAHVLAPQPGDRVWDSCAAPGSKTTQLAALMDDTGLVVATDRNLGRLSALRSNTERLGATNVAVTRENAQNHSLKPFGGALYDHALVDPPCSCEGTIRKNPDALDDWSLDRVRGVAGVQKGVLRRAIQATATGGRVVYSTCTFAPEENEAVLNGVLESESCRLIDFDLPLDHTGGITDWQGESYNETVGLAKRIYPHHNDTGGFFVGLLEVTAS